MYHGYHFSSHHMTGPCQLWPSLHCACAGGLEGKRVYSRRRTCPRVRGIGTRKPRWTRVQCSLWQRSCGWTASMHHPLQDLPYLLGRRDVGPPEASLGHQLHCLTAVPSGREKVESHCKTSHPQQNQIRVRSHLSSKIRYALLFSHDLQAPATYLESITLNFEIMYRASVSKLVPSSLQSFLSNSGV